MKAILTVAAAVAVLALASGPARAADCFGELKTETSKMISTAEQKGDMKTASEAKRLSTEAQDLYDSGKRNDAVIRIVRSMEMVQNYGSGGH